MLIPASNSEPVRPGRFFEHNDCHNPPGPGGGQFCSGPLHTATYSKGSKSIPEHLKADVARAKASGIEVFHSQQPEPVVDVTGQTHDPLALSHAEHGEHPYWDAKTGLQYTGKGRVFLSTRGGEYDPFATKYEGEYLTPKRVRKTTSPEDLRDPATPADVEAVFRHEVGHILRRDFKSTAKAPYELASEIVAWQHAIENSPNFRVKETWVRSGLLSHAYTAFRKQAIEKEWSGIGFRGSSWDRDERLELRVKQESKEKFVDEDALRKARQFTYRVLKSFRRYGDVLRKRGGPARRPRSWRDDYTPKPRYPTPGGPGRGF